MSRGLGKKREHKPICISTLLSSPALLQLAEQQVLSTAKKISSQGGGWILADLQTLRFAC